MAKLTKNQLRSLVRESINEVKNKKETLRLKKRLNLKIAERKLTFFSREINESSVEISNFLLSEGWLENLKGGVSAAVSDLGREFFGGGAMPRGGYKGRGGLKSYELERMAAADPLRAARETVKKVPDALKRLKSTKISDLVDGHGLIALDSYVSTVVDSLKSLAEFLKNQRELEEQNPEHANQYADLASKVSELFDEAKEVIKSMQRDIQQAAIDLQTGSEPALQVIQNQ